MQINNHFQFEKLSFWQAFKNVYFKKIFTYRGRSSRRELWKSLGMFMLLSIPFGVAFGMVIFLLKSSAPLFLSIFNITISAVLYVWLLAANLSLTCRRMHDIGLSFAWYWIPSIVTFVEITYSLRIYLHKAEVLPVELSAWFPLLFLINIIFTLIILFWPSQNADNRFGNNPYGSF